MQQTLWNMQHIKQCSKRVGQAVLSDEHRLVLFSQDFGQLKSSKPSALFVPQSTEDLQKMIGYAHEHALPVTIRGNGMSQCGQSLPVPGGLSMHLEKFNKVVSLDEDRIWVEANTSWADLLQVSLTQGKIPYVLPYNCNLSVAGVISAGGVGASSFKWGSVTANIEALEVVTANGEIQQVDKGSSLFHACLGGQGRFGVITKACIKLKSCQKKVRTFFLLYLDKESWLADLAVFEQKVDYIEFFCSPAVQGAKLSPQGRFPFAQWFFCTHIAVEYDEQAPELTELNSASKAWKQLHVQDESIDSYLHRHDSRFNAMKLTGQWNLAHPWYECFVPRQVLVQSLDELLPLLPIHYATVLQVVPIKHAQPRGFFMLADAKDSFAVMVLNPGVVEALVPSCLATIKNLDERLLKQGGKRYLSGFLGQELTTDYWKNHFGKQYEEWIKLKETYDERQIFCSLLYE